MTDLIPPRPAYQLLLRDECEHGIHSSHVMSTDPIEVCEGGDLYDVNRYGDERILIPFAGDTMLSVSISALEDAIIEKVIRAPVED